MTTSSILFLDFDGVINSVRSATAFGGYPWNVNKESLRLFDPIAINLIRKLCNEHNVKIVLSSTWRKGFNFNALAKVLDLPIIDQTPIKLSASRGQEIQLWLDTHPGVEYAILDDDADMLETQMSRFIKTDPYEGLSWKCYERLCKLFEEVK